MQMHPREKQIDEAERVLSKAILKLHKMDLTHNEFISVVTQVMSTTVLTTTKYAIRRERHGDPEQPGGLA